MTPATATRTKAATTKRSRSVGRVIEQADRARLLATLSDEAASRSFLALRTRAFVLLCWGSALRVSEAVALDISQVLDHEWPGSRGVRATGIVHGAVFAIPTVARAALREYLEQRQVTRRSRGPLFVALDSTRRLSVRSAQHAWDELQRRAALAQHYRTDDLRHDAITRFSNAAKGDVRRVQAFGRFTDIHTAARYVRTQVTSLAELSELAELA